MRNKKKILFLTHYYPPEVNAPANRTHDHCARWKEFYDITVLTNYPNHPDGRLYVGYKNKLYSKEVLDGINIIRVLTFITPNEGFILRSLNYVFYMIMAVMYVLLSKIKYDIVIATSPQFFCGLAGKIIAGLKKKPFILELRDLWPESIIAVGAIKSKPIITLLQKLEISLYNSAVKIISVTSSFKEHLISRGINENKIEIIYNGVDVDSFSSTGELKCKDIEEFIRTGFIVGYIGTVGMAHGIDTIVKCAEIMTEDDVKFIIVGSGAERENIERMIKEKGLNNIKLFPIQPRSEIMEIISRLDIFLVHLRKQELFKTVIPSKIFEGMALKKPILIGVDGEVRRIIEDSKCGVYFEPENSIQLVEKIILLKNEPSIRISYGIAGWETVNNRFDRKELANKFMTIIQSIIE